MPLTKLDYKKPRTSFLGFLSLSLGSLTLGFHSCHVVKSPTWQETKAANNHVSKSGRGSPPATQPSHQMKPQSWPVV